MAASLCSAVAGDSCVRNYDGSAGVCTPSSSCPSAIALLQQAGIRPDICGYNRAEPIICCVQPRAPAPPPPTPASAPIRPIISSPGSGFNQLSSKRISERMCDEYSRSVTHVVNAISLSVDAETISFAVPKCDYTGVPLIVGGEITQVGEFPHMAAIGWTQSDRSVGWWCGGALISDQFVLTAAHCTSVQNVTPDVVRLGEQNIKSNNDGAQPVDIQVSNIIRHPSYRYPSKYNDIALLKLIRPATLSKFIRPACLWQRDNFNKKASAVATGWGRIDFAEDQSDELLKVVIDIIDNNQCAPLYADQVDRRLRNGIIDTQLCAGVLGGGKDTCKGDSGGPLQIPNTSNQCIFNIIGVTSFGKGCGTPNSPGVYTRVSKFVDWIESVVWPGQ